jgi:hypothetical protein
MMGLTRKFQMKWKIPILLLGWACIVHANTLPVSAQPSYAELAIPDEESQIIYRIIDLLGSRNEIVLGFKRSKMKKLGQEVQHVHPFVFLQTIFCDPHLKESMQKVLDSWMSFKWDGFMHGDGEVPGFIHKCEKEHQRGNLLPYVEAFSQKVGADPSIVRDFVEKREWEDLVKYLIES